MSFYKNYKKIKENFNNQIIILQRDSDMYYAFDNDAKQLKRTYKKLDLYKLNDIYYVPLNTKELTIIENLSEINNQNIFTIGLDNVDRYLKTENLA